MLLITRVADRWASSTAYTSFRCRICTDHRAPISDWHDVGGKFLTNQIRVSIVATFMSSETLRVLEDLKYHRSIFLSKL